MSLSLEEQHEMILENQKLVHFIVSQLKVAPSDYDDLVSIGTIGLIKAAATFDETQEPKFSTYAATCIRNEIFAYYRKTAKQQNEVFFSQPVTENKDGRELLVETSIAHPDSDFTEKIIDKQTFVKLFSIVLNYLNGIEQYIILYWLANIIQPDIGKLLNTIQSNVSRLKIKAIDKIKYCLENDIKYREVFSVEAIGNSYKISFSSKDIPGFNRIFASLLQDASFADGLPQFKLNYNEERVVLLLPASSESFAFLAKIMQEIDSFCMVSISDNTEGNTGFALARSRKPTFKRGERFQQMKDYVLSKDFFTYTEMKENFPYIKEGTIAQFLRRQKHENVITSIGKGKYTVNKS